MNSPERQQPNPEAFHELQNPDFNAGNVVALLSTDPKGFEIVTNKTLRRKEGPLGFDKEEREQLVGAMGGEMRFTGGAKAQEELDKLRNTPENSPNLSEAREEYEKARLEYVNKGNKPKVGLRNIRREGNRLIVDIKPVSFPVYKIFSKPELSPERRSFAEAATTSMIFVTADNKILVQHRSERNELYGDMPGASVAGYLDGELDRPKQGERGMLKPINEESALSNIKNESREEMGIEESDYTEIILTGLCEEIKPTPHHEFLFMAKTKLTSEQIKEKSLQTARARRNELKPEHIDDKFAFIDATPDAIFTLLTQVKCPIPPTHAMAFAALGYELVLKSDGKEKADEYKKRLGSGMKENYERIDEIVKEYYDKNPNSLKEVPDRFKDKSMSARNLKGYDPRFFPREQGLPSFEPALKAEGLIAA